MEEVVLVKKCGNCGHLAPKIEKKTRKEKTQREYAYLKELHSGVCDLTGKVMSGALIAGCFYWCSRELKDDQSRERWGGL